MQSKGLVTPEEFLKYNNSVVILLEMEKYCWTNKQRFTADIKVANYHNQALKNKIILCEISQEANSKIFARGNYSVKIIANGGLTQITTITMDSGITKCSPDLPGKTNGDFLRVQWVYLPIPNIPCLMIFNRNIIPTGNGSRC